MSLGIRQNFPESVEEALNEQINLELSASYAYLSMAAYAGRDLVALPGLQKFCKESSEDERKHAEKIINHVNVRGGTVVLKTIGAPECGWKSALHIMETVVSMERNVNERLLKLHHVAEEGGDCQTVDFIEGELLKEQIEDLKVASDMLTTLKRAGGDGLGLYLWDHELLDS
jgi:ferritin heavy chain